MPAFCICTCLNELASHALVQMPEQQLSFVMLVGSQLTRGTLLTCRAVTLTCMCALRQTMGGEAVPAICTRGILRASEWAGGP